MWASAQGNVDRVKLLIKSCADVNVVDDVFGSTALMEASTVEITQLLIEAGADINLSAKYGWTALEQSVSHGQYKKVKLLLANGANSNATGWLGKTALMEASGIGRKEMVKLIVESGADVNAKDNEGHNALWYACNHTDKRVSRLFLEPAPEEVYGEIIKFLKDAGAEEK